MNNWISIFVTVQDLTRFRDFFVFLGVLETFVAKNNSHEATKSLILISKQAN